MQSGRFKPNILTLRTVFTTGLDEFPRGNHSPSVFLQTGGSDPPRRVFWIRLYQGIEEHSSSFNVANLGFGLDSYAVEGGEVSLWINGSRYSGSYTRHLVQLERQNLVASLSNFHKIGQSSRICGSFKSTRCL